MILETERVEDWTSKRNGGRAIWLGLLRVPGRPWHTHRQRPPLTPGEIVPVQIEILPLSTLFESGSSLAIEVLGCDAAPYPAFRHRNTVNRGYHTIQTGGRFDSHLLVPRVC